MRTLHALVALLLGCGGAAEAIEDAPGAPELTEEAPAVAPEPGPHATAPALTARPKPVVAPPEFRSCISADECELRTSVCRPLVAGGGPRWCRDARLDAGEVCDHHNDCEPGLYCLRQGTTQVYLCGAGTGVREALSCDPDPRTQVDAGCEEVTDD